MILSCYGALEVVGAITVTIINVDEAVPTR